MKKETTLTERFLKILGIDISKIARNGSFYLDEMPRMKNKGGTK